MRTITDPAQAKALTDVKLIGFVQAFIGQERSVTAAAELWQTRLDAAYYRVRQLERLGLIEVSNRVKRAGRDLKLYRAVADDFFVPLGVVPESALEVFLESSDSHFQAMMLRAQSRTIHEYFSKQRPGDWGIHIGMDGQNQANVHLSDRQGKDPDLSDPDMPLIASGWPTLELDPEEARGLRRELLELFRKYESRRGAQKYLLRFALAPLEEND
jgi:hypothetical protein